MSENEYNATELFQAEVELNRPLFAQMVKACWADRPGSSPSSGTLLVALRLHCFPGIPLVEATRGGTDGSTKRAAEKLARLRKDAPEVLAEVGAAFKSMLRFPMVNESKLGVRARWKPQKCEPMSAEEALSGGAEEMEAANTLADLADGVDEAQGEDEAVLPRHATAYCSLYWWSLWCSAYARLVT